MRRGLGVLLFFLLLFVAVPVYSQTWDYAGPVGTRVVGHGDLDGVSVKVVARIEVEPVIKVKLMGFDPANIYVVDCGGSCTQEEVRSELLSVFVEGTGVNPRIPVYDGKAYVPVYAGLYDVLGYYFRVVVSDVYLYVDGERVPVEGKTVFVPATEDRYTGVLVAKLKRPFATVVITYWVDLPDEYIYVPKREECFIATDGAALVYAGMCDYRISAPYEDRCIRFPPNPVMLTEDVQLDLFECRPDRSFSLGHNYETARYANMPDVDVRIEPAGFGSYYVYGIVKKTSSMYDASFEAGVSVSPVGSVVKPDVFSEAANLMLWGFAGVQSFVEILDILSFASLTPLGTVGLFLLGTVLTYFILRFAYDIVKSKRPDLLPWFWLSVILFGDIGALVFAVLVMVFG